MPTYRRPMPTRTLLVPLVALLALSLLALPAEAKKKKDDKLASVVCTPEGVKLGPRALTVELDFDAVRAEQRVRENGTFCFEHNGATYEVTPSLSKDRMGFVDLVVKRIALDGERELTLHFHVHDEQFLDASNNWPELVRFEVVRVVPPLNRSMVGPRTDGGTVIKN
jgi:hypothetical protein